MRRISGALLGIILLAFSIAGGAQSQEPVVLPSTYRHVIQSGHNGAEYQLTIVLPSDYEENPGVRYPTLYVMDGNRWASLLAVILPRLTRSGGYPPMIVVGVDYPQQTGRFLDYGPVSQRYFPVPENRGYANFLRVMREEIIPMVDTTYRTDPQDRGIGGHSMGGLFAAYALLNATDTFHRFWISSPSLFYDNEILFEDFEAFRRQQVQRPLYVFTSVGEDELPTMISTIERFGQRAREAQPDHVILRMMVVPETDHATVVPAIFAPALEHLYMYRRQITPAASDLHRVSGFYERPDGVIMTFVTDGRTLMYSDSTIDYDNGALIRMIASAPNRFFQRGSATEYQFSQGDGPADRVRILRRRSGEWIEAMRVPPREFRSSERQTILGTP